MPTPAVPPRLGGPSDRRTALAEGLTEWHLRHRGILRTSRDTYLPEVLATSLRPRIDAVLLRAPGGTVVSHRTAAALWGYDLPLLPADERVHLTVPPGSRVRSRRDRCVHCSVVPKPETRVLRGLSVTSPSRTWIDLAGVLPAGALLALTDQMLAGGFPVEEFPRILDRSRGRRGVARARSVLPCADAMAGSPMESVLRWLLHEHGLPRPVLQYVIRNAAGDFLGRVDLAWPDRKVLVEFDGDLHRERRVFVNDLRRQNGLVLAGWQILRFTSADVLGRAAATVRTIAVALGPS